MSKNVFVHNRMLHENNYRYDSNHDSFKLLTSTLTDLKKWIRQKFRNFQKYKCSGNFHWWRSIVLTCAEHFIKYFIYKMYFSLENIHIFFRHTRNGLLNHKKSIIDSFSHGTFGSNLSKKTRWKTSKTFLTPALSVVFIFGRNVYCKIFGLERSGLY